MELVWLLLSSLLIVSPLIPQHGDAQVIQYMDVGPQEPNATVTVATGGPNAQGDGDQLSPEDTFNKHWQRVIGDTEHIYKIKEIKTLDFDKLVSILNHRQENGVETITKHIEKDRVKEKYEEEDAGGKEAEKVLAGETPEGNINIDGRSNNGVVEVENDTIKDERAEDKTVKEYIETTTLTGENAKDNIGKMGNKIKEGINGTNITEKEEKIIKEVRKEKDLIKEESEDKISIGGKGEMGEEDIVKEESEEDDLIQNKLEKEIVVKEQVAAGDNIATIKKVEHVTEEKTRLTKNKQIHVIDTESEKTTTDGVNVDAETKTEGPIDVSEETVMKVESQSVIVPVEVDTSSNNDKDASEPAAIVEVSEIFVTTDDAAPEVDSVRKVREARVETPSSKEIYPPSRGRSYYYVDRVPPPGWRANRVGSEGPTYKHPSKLFFGALPMISQKLGIPYQAHGVRTLQGQRGLNRLFPQFSYTQPQKPSGNKFGLEKSLAEKKPTSGNSKDVNQIDNYSNRKFFLAAPQKTSVKKYPSQIQYDGKINLDHQLEAQPSSVYYNVADYEECNLQSAYLPQTPRPHFPSFPLESTVYPIFVSFAPPPSPLSFHPEPYSSIPNNPFVCNYAYLHPDW